MLWVWNSQIRLDPQESQKFISYTKPHEKLWPSKQWQQIELSDHMKYKVTVNWEMEISAVWNASTWEGE